MQFSERSPAGQVRLLRTTATEALARFPIEARRLRLLSHGYNTTFRVDAADGSRYALRLNTSSRRTEAMIAGEMAWQAAIAADTGIRVPRPQPTSDGELVARVDCPHVGRPLSAVLYSWLPGPDLGDRVTQDQMRVVGRTMAMLHTHAETWQLPVGAELPTFDDPLLGDTDHLTDHPRPTAEQRTVLVEALDVTRREYASLFAGTTPIALHADLHQWNTKWHRGALSVFDFDDSGFGVPLQDLAITAYYVRRLDRALEDALHEGYATLRPAPKGTAAEYEANLASRNLVLLNDVLVSDNAELRAEAEHYLPLTVARLRHWLETGAFRFDLPASAAP